MSRWWSSQGSRQNWLFFFSLPPPQGICSHVSVWTLSCLAPSRWSRWAGTSRNGGSVQMSLPWRPHRDRGVSRSPETQFLCISNLNHPSHFIPLSTGDLKGTLSFRPSTRSCLLWVTGHQRPPSPHPHPHPLSSTAASWGRGTQDGFGLWPSSQRRPVGPVCVENVARDGVWGKPRRFRPQSFVSFSCPSLRLCFLSKRENPLWIAFGCWKQYACGSSVLELPWARTAVAVPKPVRPKGGVPQQEVLVLFQLRVRSNGHKKKAQKIQPEALKLRTISQ